MKNIIEGKKDKEIYIMCVHGFLLLLFNRANYKSKQKCVVFFCGFKLKQNFEHMN